MRRTQRTAEAAKTVWRNGTVELADGRLIGIAEFGPADGFPIMWFHGTPGARRQVPPRAVDYAHQAGVRIIGVERPGVGRSSPHRYARIIDWADDIAEVLDRLGLDRFGVIGLSGGGPYALAACARMPDRAVAAAILGGVAPASGPERVGGGVVPGLRLIRPVVDFLAEPMARVMSGALKIAGPFADIAFDAYMTVGPRSDRALLARPEMREMFLDDLLSAGRISFRAVAYDAVLFTRWWGFDIADITVPLYFWHGDADLVIPLEHGRRMAEIAPNSRLSVVSGEGHLAMLDVAEEAIDWILSHREPAAG